MIKRSLFIVNQYWRYYFLHVGNFTAGRNNHSSRRNHFLAVRILLCHRQRVFSGRNIDLQCAAEVAQCFYSRVQTGIFTFLRTARPHPVGRQRNAVHTFRHRSPNKIGKCFRYGKDRTGSRISQCCLRSMSDRSSYPFFATVVKCNDTAVTQRQLKFALTLLTCHFTCYRAVYLIRQPVFAGNSFKLQYIRQIFM